MPLPAEMLNAVVDLDTAGGRAAAEVLRDRTGTVLRDSGHPDGAYVEDEDQRTLAHESLLVLNANDIGDAAVHNRPLIRAAEPLFFNPPVIIDKPRINGRAIQQMCADGRWKPTRNRVLLEALWETDGGGILVETARQAGIGHKAREAIAFVVKAIGPGVPNCGFAVGDVVTHNSAAGDPVDHTDESCPYWTVHFEDITGVAA